MEEIWVPLKTHAILFALLFEFAFLVFFLMPKMQTNTQKNCFVSVLDPLSPILRAAGGRTKTTH